MYAWYSFPNFSSIIRSSALRRKANRISKVSHPLHVPPERGEHQLRFDPSRGDTQFQLTSIRIRVSATDVRQRQLLDSQSELTDDL